MDNYSRRTFLKLLAGGALGVAGLEMCPASVSAALHRQDHHWRNYEPAAASVEAWLKQNQFQVSDQEWKLLQRAQKTLINNIFTPSRYRKPLPWAPRRGISPSLFKYQGVWNWDAAFHAVGTSRWDAELARDQVRIILAHQLPTGALPDVVFADGQVNILCGKPPVMPWACALIDRRAPDDAFLREVYDKFVPYEEHWRRDRGGDRDGLFHYNGTYTSEGEESTLAKWESGWDNSVRWDNKPYDQWAVDCNSFMIMLYQAMAYMADRLHLPDDVKKWDERHKALAAKINEKLWNPAVGAYMDRHITTGEFSGVLTPASFHPLYARIASKDQAAQMAKLAADPKGFYPGMPSVSYGDPRYQSFNYWRGPTWFNIAYFAAKGLHYYGHDKTANDIRRTILDWTSKNEDYIYEYYDSKTGQGLGARQYGWTATFVIEFILNWNRADDL